MNNRLRKHRMTVVEVFGLTRPAWPSRQSQIRFRGRIDGIKPGEVLVLQLCVEFSYDSL